MRLLLGGVEDDGLLRRVGGEGGGRSRGGVLDLEIVGDGGGGS